MKTMIGLLTLLITTASYAGNAEIEMRMTLRNEFNKSYTVICGVDKNAGDSLDKNLGEFAFPNFPLDGFHAAWIVTDLGERVLSYKDFRTKKIEMYYVVEYKLALPAPSDVRGKVIDFTWAWPLHQNIDSVTVIDEFDGLFLKQKLDNTEKFITTGSAANLEKFNVKVYYNNKVVSVVEYKDELVLTPNPTSDVIRCSEELKSYTVYSVIGEVVQSGTNTQLISLENLQPGNYVVMYDVNGKTSTKLFVKL